MHQHLTRRARREQAAAAAAVDEAAHDRKRARRGRAWLIVAIVAIVLLGLAVWVAFKAVIVKNELEAAQALVANVEGGEGLSQTVADLGEHAGAAADAAGDPVWRVLEFIPALGDNLRGVRLAAESLDVVANDVGTPVLAVKDDPAGGSILGRALPILRDASPEVTRLADEVADVHASSFLVGPVRSGVDQVHEVMSAAGPVLEVLPKLLGAEGPRSYLLIFQNNAETLPLGGSAASQTLVNVDAGDIQLAQQAGSRAYANGTPVDVPVDQSAIDLYSDYLVAHMNTTMSRPDFPTAAQLVRAFWNRDVNPDPVHGVVSIDPIALARVLKATGPLQLITGDTIDETNAVRLLLSEVYARWDSYTPQGADMADAFFASVAATVFEKVSTGDFDFKHMAWAVQTSIDNGDILMWMEDPEVAQMIDGQKVSGVLPKENDDQTTVGVYFRDTSASKIDYYMKSSIDVAANCEGAATTFTANARLHLDIDQAAADNLPRYVQSRDWGTSQFRTEVFVYGPPGTEVLDVSVDGRDVRPLRTDITDLGRPVAAFETFLRPGEAASVVARFTGEGEFGPLELWSTPMVQASQKTVEGACLG
ncbi:DUF4012 domain-containing protein [Microbacterium sp. NPDC096154]|uniref:DUF4012 domain-containing protein n=1 Tax=Microbacterium sp. NPDC096154 TaxID=3155549 RepID=UPI003316856B